MAELRCIYKGGSDRENYSTSNASLHMHTLLTQSPATPRGPLCSLYLSEGERAAQGHEGHHSANWLHKHLFLLPPVNGSVGRCHQNLKTTPSNTRRWQDLVVSLLCLPQNQLYLHFLQSVYRASQQAKSALYTAPHPASCKAMHTKGCQSLQRAQTQCMDGHLTEACLLGAELWGCVGRSSSK